MSSLTGAKELIKAMEDLAGSGVRRATKRGVDGGLKVCAKSIKSKIPPKYKHLKKIVGSRYAKAKGGAAKGQMQAKVGFGVGMKRMTGKKGQKKLSTKFQSRKNRAGGGTGISAANIHWLVLGTQERSTSGGKSTGKMPAILRTAVPDGMAAAEGQAIAAIETGVREGIAREVAKAKK